VQTICQYPSENHETKPSSWCATYKVFLPRSLDDFRFSHRYFNTRYGTGTSIQVCMYLLVGTYGWSLTDRPTDRPIDRQTDTKGTMVVNTGTKRVKSTVNKSCTWGPPCVGPTSIQFAGTDKFESHPPGHDRTEIQTFLLDYLWSFLVVLCVR
jgi:hypothetical protein